MHIAIEGMDGVGKTTAAKLLAARLGFRVVEKPLHYLIDEPDQTTNYLRCRDYINEQMDNDALRAWFYGLGNLYLYHRFRDEDVITDRHLLSNYFWCGSKATEPLFRCLVDLIGSPDFTVLLLATPEAGFERIRGRDPADSDLHKAGLYLESRVKMETFLRRYDMTYIAIDTTSLTPEQVVDQIVEALPPALRAHVEGRLQR